MNPSMHPVSDTELMIRTQQGDLHCMGLLFMKHQPVILKYLIHRGVRAADAEDLAQETFWRMLRYRDSFQNRYPFRAWMYQIARNCHADYLQKLKRNPHMQDDTSGIEETEAPEDIRRHMNKKDDKAILRKALKALPEEKRELLILARFQGLTHREIGKLIGCKESTVKVRIHRALGELKNLFVQFSERKMA